MDATLHKDEAELGILVLAVSVEMLTDCHCLYTNSDAFQIQTNSVNDSSIELTRRSYFGIVFEQTFVEINKMSKTTSGITEMTSDISNKMIQ